MEHIPIFILYIKIKISYQYDDIFLTFYKSNFYKYNALYKFNVGAPIFHTNNFIVEHCGNLNRQHRKSHNHNKWKVRVKFQVDFDSRLATRPVFHMVNHWVKCHLRGL
jgi:hypothetical protein